MTPLVGVSKYQTRLSIDDVGSVPGGKSPNIPVEKRMWSGLGRGSFLTVLATTTPNS